MQTIKTIYPMVFILGFLLSACDNPLNKLSHTPPPTEPALTTSPAATDVMTPTEEAISDPSMTATADVPQTPMDSVGDNLTSTPTPLPPNTYLNEDYQFAFQIPGG